MIPMKQLPTRSESTGCGLSPWESAGSRPGPLAFDDLPLDSLLGMQSAATPTPASQFAAAEAAWAATRRTDGIDHDIGTTLRHAAGTLRSGLAVPASMLAEFVGLLGKVIPAVPLPLVADHGVAYETVLDPCFRIARAGHHQRLLIESGTLLYRWYESCGRYSEARSVIAELLANARQRGGWVDVAVLTNNYGYEYMLEGEWSSAERIFARAGGLFAAHDGPVEVANAASNRLLCAYEIDGRLSPEPIERQARELLVVLAGDWRRRKLLVLLAQIEEQRGHLADAVSLVEKSLEASHGVATRHRHDDRRYLDSLRRAPSE